MRKIHCSTRKNTIRNNHFIHELTPWTPPEITNLLKNLLLGLEFIIWLCVLSSPDKLLASINCCKTHHQPNSFTHSLTNLLYWAYWAHILFYLGLGYDLWPYIIYLYQIKNNLLYLYVMYIKCKIRNRRRTWRNTKKRVALTSGHWVVMVFFSVKFLNFFYLR